MATSRPTVPPELQRDPDARSWGHTLTTLVLALIMLALLVDATGKADIFGVDTATERASGGGYELAVTSPSVTRPGLASPVRITVRQPGGFDGPVDVAVERRYLQQYDFNRFYPEPSGDAGDGDFVVLTFDTPATDELVIELDGRLEPGVQVGRGGRFRVMDDGDVMVEVRVDLRVWP